MMLKAVPSFILAVGFATAGVAQQPSSPAMPEAAAKKPAMKHTTPNKRSKAPTGHDAAPSPAKSRPIGDATSDRNDPAGTVPVGAPGTTDPTIPGAPPQM